MKHSLLFILITLTFGCASIHDGGIQHSTDAQAGIENSNCIGTVSIPAEYTDRFTETEDPQLLAESLGSPDQGKLCQGKVYTLKKDKTITIYRAWNSTNPNSRFGQWWSFSKPSGKVAQYRTDYEICYQWSPLDKLVECRLKSGSEIVVGTGQSASCSQYLQYPTSESLQIYLKNADDNLSSCNDYDALLDWQKTVK